MEEDIKVKEVSASYKGSKNYNSIEVSMTADVTNLMDEDSAATTLLGKCMNLVSKKLKEVPDEEFVPEAPSQEELKCSNCSKPISPKVNDYSSKNFGRSLCMDCQKEAKKIEEK